MGHDVRKPLDTRLDELVELLPSSQERTLGRDFRTLLSLVGLQGCVGRGAGQICLRPSRTSWAASLYPRGGANIPRSALREVELASPFRDAGVLLVRA